MISTMVIYNNITGAQIKRLCEQKKIITKASSHSDFKYSASLFSSEMTFSHKTQYCVSSRALLMQCILKCSSTSASGNFFQAADSFCKRFCAQAITTNSQQLAG